MLSKTNERGTKEITRLQEHYDYSASSYSLIHLFILLITFTVKLIVARLGAV